VQLSGLVARLDSLGRRRWVIGAVATLAFLFLYAQARYSLFTRDTIVDSRSYYFAAKALERGLNPYDPEVLQALASPDHRPVYPYLYPPFIASIWRPLTSLDPDPAHLLWVAVQTVLAAANAALLWSLIRPRSHRGAWLLGFLALHAVCGPLVSTLRLGQINVLLGSLVFGALACERSGRATCAGILLSLSILTKLTPAIFLVDLFWRRRWRAILACGATTLVCVSSSILLDGPGVWASFLARAASPLPFNSPSSLGGAIEAVGRPIGLQRSTAGAISVAVLIAVGWRLLRNFPRLAHERDAPVPMWSALTLFGLLAFPLTWHHHYYMALLPFGCFVPRVAEREREREREREEFTWDIVLWSAVALAALLRYPGALHPLKPLSSVIALLAL
jgi:hypothetical protein